MNHAFCLEECCDDICVQKLLMNYTCGHAGAAGLPSQSSVPDVQMHVDGFGSKFFQYRFVWYDNAAKN